MAQYSFGSGSLYGIPTRDSAGNPVLNGTPQKFGVLQDVSVDFGYDVKMLHGQLQFPVDVARGKASIKCKAKFGKLNGALYNSLFFGQTLTSGTATDILSDIAGSMIPASAPYTVTPAAPNAGTVTESLSVIGADGTPYDKVEAIPTTGQYTLSGGIFTFAAADAGKKVFIDFKYTYASPTAKTITVLNQQMGFTPEFKVELSQKFKGKPLTFTFPKAVSSKLMFPGKNDDYNIPEFEFEVFADETGNVAFISFGE